MTWRKHSSARARAKRLADEDQTRAAPDDRRASISHQAPLLERMANDPNAPLLSSRQLQGLQATRGNQHVQRLVKGTPLQQRSDRDVLAREAAGATDVSEAASTVFKPVVNKTYNVSATTLAKAAAKVEAYQEAHGEAGKTEWKPKLDYKRDESGNVKSASVVITITVTMPSWPGAAKVSTEAQAEWDRAYKELEDHEQEHVNIVHEQLEGLAESLIGKSKKEADEAFKEALANLQTASDGIDPFVVEVDTSIE
jgi:predicted secreted Zn-dependent protease